MELLLIDNHDENNGNVRLDKLSERLDNAGFSVSTYSNVWGSEIYEDTPDDGQIKNDCQKVLDKNGYRVLFIHSSNKFALYFSNKFLEEFDNCYVVSYSGGGSDIDIESDRHHAFSSSVNEQGEADWNLEAFKKAIEKNEPNPFYKLTGFNPKLEASINLWKSLTMLGIKIQKDLIEEADYKKETARLLKNDDVQPIYTEKWPLFSDWKKYDSDMEELYKELFPQN